MPDWSEHIFRIEALPLEILKFRGESLMGIIVQQARAVARFLRQEAGDYVLFSARW